MARYDSAFTQTHTHTHTHTHTQKVDNRRHWNTDHVRLNTRLL